VKGEYRLTASSSISEEQLHRWFSEAKELHTAKDVMHTMMMKSLFFM
jgi:hypothetical protein